MLDAAGHDARCVDLAPRDGLDDRLAVRPQPDAPALFGSDIDTVDPLVASTVTRVRLTADQVQVAAAAEPATSVGLEPDSPTMTVPTTGPPTANVVVHCPVLATGDCEGVLEVFRKKGGAAIGAAGFTIPSGISGSVKVPLKPPAALLLGLTPGVSAPVWLRATTTSGTSSFASVATWTITP